MATTIFDKPLDKELAASNQAIANNAQAIAMQTTVQDDRIASDANNAKDGGTWYLLPSSTNRPDTYGFYTLFVIRRNANNVTQTAIDINSGNTYVRSYHDGTTWTNWQQLATIATLNSNLANLVEQQNISTSGMGFNGSMKESNGTITLKNGYTPYILHLTTNNYSQNNYIHYWGGINKINGTFFFEHNLTANSTSITVTILWIKNN